MNTTAPIDPSAATSTLDPIRHRLTKVKRDIANFQHTQAEIRRQLQILTAEQKRLEGALATGKYMELRVSEHALLRYAERALGFDTQTVMQLIDNHVAPAATLLGDGKYPIGVPGLRAVVTNGVVVTIEPV